MPDSVRVQAVIESLHFPAPRKGEGALARVTFTMPVRENRELVSDLILQRGNAVDLTIVPLQISLPDEAPTPMRQRRGSRAAAAETADPPPDPGSIPHEYQAPTSKPGGDCVVCGTGPNADIHAEQQDPGGEVSPEAQALIDAANDGDA